MHFIIKREITRFITLWQAEMFDPSVCYENSSVRSFTMGESLLMTVIVNPSSGNQGKGFNKMSFFPFEIWRKCCEDYKNILMFLFVEIRDHLCFSLQNNIKYNHWNIEAKYRSFHSSKGQLIKVKMFWKILIFVVFVIAVFIHVFKEEDKRTLKANTFCLLSNVFASTLSKDTFKVQGRKLLMSCKTLTILIFKDLFNIFLFQKYNRAPVSWQPLLFGKVSDLC